MSFFLSTKGHLHPYNFHYLQGDFEKARLERTQIHGEQKLPQTLSETKVDFYAIDIMAKPPMVKSTSASLTEVKNLMSEKGIRHVPIVENHNVIGMISDRDLLKVDLSSTFSFLKAEDVMSTVLIVAHEETPLAHIARVLLEEKLSCLPIIDSHHKLVGIISRTDILRAVVYNRLVIK